MTKKRVYLESTVISDLTAKMPSDLLRIARQKVTHDWWEFRGEFTPYVSLTVLAEIQRGDPVAVARRMQFVSGIPVLPITNDAVSLADRLVTAGAVPAKVKDDAMHIAIAAVHGMDYLVTWNQKHLVNPRQVELVYRTVRESGKTPPLLIRPDDWREVENAQE